MLAAGGDPAPADVDHARECRSHVARLYLGNTMSAKDIVDLVRKAQKAEAKGVDDLARAGGPKNAQRDLMRMLLRGCILPALYWASVPVYDTKTNTNMEMQIPFLLAHEMMGSFVARGNGWQDEVINREPDSPLGKIMGEFCVKFRLDPSKFVGVGVFFDGVPFQVKKTLEIVAWNCPTTRGERYLFSALAKEHFCRCGCKGRHTSHTIFEICSWSMRCALTGKYPSERHDRTPFGKDDAYRKPIG